MSLQHTEKPIQCQWEGCRQNACSQIFNSTGKDSAYLCQFHKRVATINIEQYDRIRAPGAVRITENLVRPGSPKKDPVRDGLKPFSKTADSEAWEKAAARKADARAVPVDPIPVDDQSTRPVERTVIKPIISNIPTPRKGS